MKTIAIQLTIVLMMIATTAFSQTAGEKEIWTSIKLKGNDKIEIRMMIPDEDVVFLNVYNQKNRKVYSKRIKNQSNLLISHMIEEFPNGVYTYEIRSNKEVVSSTAIVKSAGQDLYYKPVTEFAEAK